MQKQQGSNNKIQFVEAQRIIDHFKQWLAQVPNVYRNRLERDAETARRKKQDALERELAIARQTKDINTNLKF